MPKILSIIFLIALSLTATPPSNFQEAKSRLKSVFIDLGEHYMKTFYCKAPFTITKGRYTLLQSSAYSPRHPTTSKGTPNQRTKRIEIEHIVPAAVFSRNLPCWKNGGRKACQNDSKFRKMESDLHILFPSIGEINGDRSNFEFQEAPKSLQYTQYGNCKVYTDFKKRQFYPANYSKGYIARSYLYMIKKYNIPLTPNETSLAQTWDKLYPMDEEEKALREEIEEEMGEEFEY